MIESFEILEVPTKIQFVIPECFYRESRIRKINVFWIPAFAGMTIHCGFDVTVTPVVCSIDTNVL